MIHLFRKIRRKLVDNSNVSRYVLYAVGEILLVIIGILIALQVNEWNQVRKNKGEEKVILSNLKSEFEQNSETLNEVWQILKSSKEASMKLMSLMNKDNHIILQNNIDSLLYWTIEYYPFNPSNNVFADLVQSGRLQLIQDDSLRNRLFEWSTEMENYRNSFEEMQHFIENHILIFLIDHIALKNMDQYGNLAWKESSAFESDVTKIFKQRKYENLVDNHLYHLSLVDDHYKTFEELIASIVSRCKQ